MRKLVSIIMVFLATISLAVKADLPMKAKPLNRAKSGLIWIEVNIYQPNVEDCYNGTSVDESNHPDLFRVFPNPSHGQFTLEVSQLKAGETILVSVFNLEGKVLYFKPYELEHGSSDKIELNLAFLPEGVYFIHVQATVLNGVQQLLIY